MNLRLHRSKLLFAQTFAAMSLTACGGANDDAPAAATELGDGAASSDERAQTEAWSWGSYDRTLPTITINQAALVDTGKESDS